MFFLNKKIGIGLLLLNFCLFISCSKEEDSTSSIVIVWISPQEEEFFKALDTIHLKANVSSDQVISLIQITLKNEDNVPVKRLDDIRPNSLAHLIDLPVFLNDPHLNGRYYFDITAYSGQGSVSRFRYIQIKSETKVLSKLYVVQSDGQETGLFELRSDSMFLLKKVNGDFLASTIDNSSMRFFISGNYNGDINAIDINDSIVQWNIQSSNIPQLPFINAFSSFKDNVVIASFESGRLLGILSSGIKVHDITLESGFKPGVALYYDERFILFERIDKSSGMVRLLTQHFPSGLSRANIVFPNGSMKAMFEMPDQQVLIFSNDGPDQYIMKYNLDTEQLREIKKINKSEFRAVEKMGENIIALNSGGDIYIFDYVNSKLSLIKAGIDAQVMRFDETSETIYCLVGLKIIELDINGNILNTIAVPEKIESFELSYR